MSINSVGGQSNVNATTGISETNSPTGVAQAKGMSTGIGKMMSAGHTRSMGMGGSKIRTPMPQIPTKSAEQQ